MLKMSKLIAIIFLQLFAIIELTTARDCVCNTATLLNVRAGASTGSTVVGQIVSGTCLEYKGISGTWYQVYFSGQTAYVSRQFTSAPKTCSAPCISQTVCGAYSINTARHYDPQGYGHYDAPRGSRLHKGIDLKCVANANIYAPFPGTVVRQAKPYPDNRCCNDGFLYRGKGQWSQYEVMIFYNKMIPGAIGRSFNTGDKIGTHIGLHCSGCYSTSMTDHAHFQLYRNGVIINPTEFVMCSP